MNVLGEKRGMTPEQALATEPDLTAWVAASAGTGKTHVLTARVLRLMLTGTKPENIICLTFTKAAAAEMKNRIFKELGSWTTLPDEDLKYRIYIRTNETADEPMLARARELFTQVLDLRGGLQIQTFHSFCQSLLGRFPLEAELSPGFEALDDTDSAELMRTAKDKMLSDGYALDDDVTRESLGLVAGMLTEQTFDEVIDRLAFDAAEIKKTISIYRTFDRFLDALYARLDVSRKDSDQHLIADACAQDRFDHEGLKQLVQEMGASKSKTDVKHASAISEFLASEQDHRSDAYESYKAVFLTATLAARATVATKNVLLQNPQFQNLIEKEQGRLIFLEEKRAKLSSARATEALLRLGLKQLSFYDVVKQQRGLVDFNDMIDRTVGLFRQSELAPWILYKLDNRIDHILVDEAQDTNRDQWRVVETLATEFFAGETARDIARTVFAVGDAKQSIFSFQRADPKHFIAARDRVFNNARNAGLRAAPVPLALSFRSCEAVLSFVDAVFREDAIATEGLSPDGERVVHRFSRTGMAGRVEVWPLEVPLQKPETAQGWTPPVHQETIDDAEQRAAQRIARHIASQVGTRTLEARARKVTAGDILVLVRRRTAFVDYLSRALKGYGISVAGRDRMLITDELPVMDLLNAARFALSPDDDLVMATHLKSPFVGLDDDALFDLAYGRSGSLWDALYAKRKDAKFSKIYADLTALLNQADAAGPFEFLNYILVAKDGRKQLSGRLGAEIHDPIDELLNEALKYELQKPSSLLGFVEHVSRNNAQIKRDMEAAGDKVRIMTAHSAKGLQAPIVYLSDVTSVPDQRRESVFLPLTGDTMRSDIPVWTRPIKTLPEIVAAKTQLKDKQLSEYRRLLYVALTRAEDELYVAGWRGSRDPDPNCWYEAINAGINRLPAKEVEDEFGQPVMRFEIAQTANVEPENLDQSEAKTAAPPPAWLWDPMPEEPAPTRPLAPSRPEDEPAVLGPAARHKNIRFRRGILLHSLLQWLPDVAPEKRKTLCLAYLKKSTELSADEQNAFWIEVENILEHPQLGKLFGPESCAEVPVAGLVPTPAEPHGRAVSGQVDRLVVDHDMVLIVDYKTNRPPPVSVEGVPAVYKRQMALYRRALKAIYPDKAIKTALLWTDEARLMELPEEMTEAALEQSSL